MKIEQLNFSYQQKVIFQNLNIDFCNQAINVIIGSNGAGKTTLLDIIAGIYPKISHSQLFDFPSPKQIMYQLQRSAFFPTLTVAQTLELFSTMDSTIVAQTATMNFIKQKLQPLLSTKMGQLSGGERQIVLIYGICLLERELYLFDEPISGIDVQNAALILQMLNDLVSERHKKVIMTLHQLEQLKTISSYFILIDQKHCAFTGSNVDLLQQTQTVNVESAFKQLLQNKSNS
ncbi:ATP-binding cassette domain-containing protein [Bombilactobacillus bombi]|uniref:ATP-binding cassette domain-containing protein n=1 Tax=Bombilactobacillus bombi TaxID=1303590 RepID=UPI0015E5D8FC|nr:ATP-binding cassette domain-containing protein [Bombilactobacillus bombi]MBA1435082.1 ATP-binding cassette domain-containing protein [Bombilactobacillus bombi]